MTDPLRFLLPHRLHVSSGDPMPTANPQAATCTVRPMSYFEGPKGGIRVEFSEPVTYFNLSRWQARELANSLLELAGEE